LWSISRHPKYITSLSALSGCSGLTAC
jgi:hypothetical protein